MAVDQNHREKDEQSLICRMALRVDQISNTSSSSSPNPPRSECSPNYFCISSGLIFAGTTVLCLLGFTVVLPYEATSDWPEVTCRVVGVEYNTSICACRNPPTISDNCHADKIPCLIVTVAFSPTRARHMKAAADHKFTGSSCSRLSERTSPTSQSNLIRSNDSIVSNSGFSEVAFRQSTAEEESTTSTISLHSSSRDATGLGILSLMFERPRETRALTSASTPSDLQQSTSAAIMRRKSESLNYKTSSIIRHDLQMKVHYVFASNKSAARTNPILIEARLYRSWYEAFYEECSVQECGEEFVNEKESVKFHRLWGSKGQTFPCYYNPHNTCIAVVERASYWLAFNAVLWPSLAIGVGLAFWVTVCFGGWSRQKSSASRLSELQLANTTLNRREEPYDERTGAVQGGQKMSKTAIQQQLLMETIASPRRISQTTSL